MKTKQQDLDFEIKINYQNSNYITIEVERSIASAFSLFELESKITELMQNIVNDQGNPKYIFGLLDTQYSQPL